MDPKTFSVDWIASLEEYFDWHEMTEERKLRFTEAKLSFHAKTR